MEPWCSDCTSSNRCCSEPSSSTSRSPPIDLPRTSRNIGTHPTIMATLTSDLAHVLLSLLPQQISSHRLAPACLATRLPARPPPTRRCSPPHRSSPALFPAQCGRPDLGAPARPRHPDPDTGVSCSTAPPCLTQARAAPTRVFHGAPDPDPDQTESSTVRPARLLMPATVPSTLSCLG
jgi:hypothetical protein